MKLKFLRSDAQCRGRFAEFHVHPLRTVDKSARKGSITMEGSVIGPGAGPGAPSRLTLTFGIYCPICFVKVRNPVACPRGHVFCKSCFETWKSASGNAVRCPTCRAPADDALTLIGGPAADPDENVDFASPTLAAELAEARRLRRVRIEAVMRHYDAENTRWEEANRTLANELAAARRRIAELEQDLTRAPPTPSTASSGTLHVPSSHLTTPTKAALLKIRFRTGAGAAAPRQPNFEQDDDPLPPQKRARVDLDAARDTEAQSQVVAALQDEIERLEAENAALRQAASAVPPSPSKWPGHEISNSRLRIKELEKELAATRKALDVADDYTEKLSARIAELETTGRR